MGGAVGREGGSAAHVWPRGPGLSPHEWSAAPLSPLNPGPSLCAGALLQALGPAPPGSGMHSLAGGGGSLAPGGEAGPAGAWTRPAGPAAHSALDADAGGREADGPAILGSGT